MPRSLLTLLIVFAAALSASAADEWKETASEEGNFKVLLPGETTYANQSVDTPIGKIEMHTFMSETETGAAGVLYSDFPAAQIANSDVDTLLTNARDGAVGNVKGKLTSDKAIQVAGNPGREFTFSVGTGDDVQFNGWQRVFLVGNRMYQLIVITAGADGRPEAELEKIRGSFELTE